MLGTFWKKVFGVEIDPDPSISIDRQYKELTGKSLEIEDQGYGRSLFPCKKVDMDAVDKEIEKFLQK